MDRDTLPVGIEGEEALRCGPPVSGNQGVEPAGNRRVLELRDQGEPAAGRQLGDRITFSCERCGATVKAPAAHAGKVGRCPKCGEKNIIPTP